MVINFTDRSIADVVEVVSSDTLTTRTLVNGIDNTFAVADFYQVFNVTQMVVQGGNVVGVDEFDASAAAILPTAFSQVVVTLSSSGTIAGLPDLEADIAAILAQTTQEAQAAAVWDALIADHSVTSSFGEFVVRRLLTIAKYFSLRT
jgi:hypothetical protein